MENLRRASSYTHKNIKKGIFKYWIINKLNKIIKTEK